MKWAPNKFVSSGLMFLSTKILKGFLVGPNPTSDSNVTLFFCYIKRLTPLPPLIFFYFQSFTVC